MENDDTENMGLKCDILRCFPPKSYLLRLVNGLERTDAWKCKQT